MDSRRRRWASAVTLGGAVLLGGPAVAGQTPPPLSAGPATRPFADWQVVGWPAPQEEPLMSWYGWQALIPGIAAQVLFGVGSFAGLAQRTWAAGPLVAGILANPVSPAIVHWAHGNQRTAWLSFGIHTTATIAALVLQEESLCTPDDVKGDACAAPGSLNLFALRAAALVIMGTALALDVGFLAHEPASTKPPPMKRNLALVPVVLPLAEVPGRGLARGFGVGLAGCF